MLFIVGKGWVLNILKKMKVHEWKKLHRHHDIHFHIIGPLLKESISYQLLVLVISQHKGQWCRALMILVLFESLNKFLNNNLRGWWNEMHYDPCDLTNPAQVNQNLPHSGPFPGWYGTAVCYQYLMVSFLQRTLKRRPISCPKCWGMGVFCEFIVWTQSSI